MIALRAGQRDVGYAVLEGKDLLLFGVRRLKGRSGRDRQRDLVRFVRELGTGFRVSALVGRANGRSQNSAAMDRDIPRIARSAAMRGIILRHDRVAQTLTGDPKGSMREIAEAIVTSYPYLARYLKVDVRTRKFYWFRMFEAVALGITAHEERVKAQLLRALREATRLKQAA